MNETSLEIHGIIHLLLIIGLLGNYSCDNVSWKENFEEDTTFQESAGLLSSTENEVHALLIDQTDTLDETGTLERKMQWASFISARIFCENDEARNEVFTQLDGGNTEYIDHLIGANSYTPTFKQLFINWVYNYQSIINQNGRPVFNEGIPPIGSDSAAVFEYIDYLTVENCIELFFPNGLSEDGSPDCSSTAHPLLPNVNENYGFRRNCNEGDISIGAAIPSIEVVPVNLSYVAAGYLIVVARPYRILNDPICQYSAYSIDFSLFLNH